MLKYPCACGQSLNDCCRRHVCHSSCLLQPVLQQLSSSAEDGEAEAFGSGLKQASRGKQGGEEG